MIVIIRRESFPVFSRSRLEGYCDVTQSARNPRRAKDSRQNNNALATRRNTSQHVVKSSTVYGCVRVCVFNAAYLTYYKILAAYSRVIVYIMLDRLLARVKETRVSKIYSGVCRRIIFLNTIATSTCKCRVRDY